MATGVPVKFEQDEFRVRFVGLSKKAPNYPVTTMAIGSDGEPHQETDFVRKERPRLEGVGRPPFFQLLIDVAK